MRRTNHEAVKWLVMLGLVVGCDEYYPGGTHGGGDPSDGDGKGEDGKDDHGDTTGGHDGTSGDDKETAGHDSNGYDTQGDDNGSDGHDSGGDGHGKPKPNDEPWCGNGIVEGNEECDGKDLVYQTCGSLGYDEGLLGCKKDCTFDKTKCDKYSCDNGKLDPSEVCDGSKLGGNDCYSQGYAAGGTLKCAPGCMSYDTSECESDCCSPNDTPGCDDGSCKALICSFDSFCCENEWDEQCAYEAQLYCKTCGGHPPVCGDGIAEAGEVCDKDDLAYEDCYSQGFEGGGTLKCKKDCSGYDTSKCADNDCCVEHDGPGCQTDECESIVCAYDPFCCQVSWDSVCVQEAEKYCGVCGGKPKKPNECDNGNDDGYEACEPVPERVPD